MRTTGTIDKEVKPTVEISIYVPYIGEFGTLRDADIVSGSLVFKHGTSAMNAFTIGGAIAGCVDFSIFKSSLTGYPLRYLTQKWDNSYMHIVLSCPDGNGGTTSCNMGWYFIDSHRDGGNVIHITAYDVLALFDEHEVYELGYPAERWETGVTIGELLTKIRSVVGNFQSFSGLTSADNAVVIHNVPDDHMSLRVLVGYIAQMFGKFVRSGTSGNTTVSGQPVVFSWYDLSSPVNAGTTFSHEFYNNNVTFRGVEVVDSNDTPLLQIDSNYSNYNPIKICNNPLIDQDNVEYVANAIYNAIGGSSGFTFRPGTASILASPAYQAGDVIQVTTGQEQNVKMIVTSTTYKLGVKEQIRSDSDPEARDIVINKPDYAETIKDLVAKAVEEKMSEIETRFHFAAQGSVRVIWLHEYPNVGTISNGEIGKLIASTNVVSSIPTGGDTWYCDIEKQALCVPAYESLIDLALTGTGGVRPFPLRVRVSVHNSDSSVRYRGWVDLMAGYMGDQNRLAITDNTSSQTEEGVCMVNANNTATAVRIFYFGIDDNIAEYASDDGVIYSPHIAVARNITMQGDDHCHVLGPTQAFPGDEVILTTVFDVGYLVRWQGRSLVTVPGGDAVPYSAWFDSMNYATANQGMYRFTMPDSDVAFVDASQAGPGCSQCYGTGGISGAGIGGYARWKSTGILPDHFTLRVHADDSYRIAAVRNAGGVRVTGPQTPSETQPQEGWDLTKDAEYYVYLTGNATIGGVQALFTSNGQYFVKVIGDHLRTKSIDGTFNFGNVIKVTVRPEDGYSITSVSAVQSSGAMQGKAISLIPQSTPTPTGTTAYTFMMPRGNVDINVQTEAQTYAITVNAPAGHASVAAPSQAAIGETVQVVVAPDSGYRISQVRATQISGGHVGQGVPLTATSGEGYVTYTFTMPDGDVRFTVSIESTS